MQEIIVLTIAAVALAYLIIKFIIKRKSHNCDKCGISEGELKKP